MASVNTKATRTTDAAGGRGRRLFGVAGEYLGLLAVLATMVGLFGSLSDHFVRAQTFATIANQIPDLTVIAVGMTFVLIIAGIDLSVGSVMALCASLLGLAMVDWGWPVVWSAALAISVGLCCGLANGIISVWWSIPSFIVTLGMLEIARGCSYLSTNSQTKYIGASIEWIGAPLADAGLSPAFFVAVGIVLCGQFLLSQTVFGRHLVAIGTNEQAVRLSGINPAPAKVMVFALAGMLAGLGGVFQASRLSSADPNAGIGLELAAIAAVVIGGTSLMGGRGSVVSSFLGVLIIAVLQSGLAQIGATEPTKRLITGLVIVVAVIVDACRQRFAARRSRS
jgi:ribose transport system permease protein